MKRVLVGAALIILAGSSARAQQGPFIWYRSGIAPEQFAVILSGAAFKEIALNPGQRSKALDIIIAERKVETALDPKADDFRERIVQLTLKRNADLRALLVTDADKFQFDQNVKNGSGVVRPKADSLLMTA